MKKLKNTLVSLCLAGLSVLGGCKKENSVMQTPNAFETPVRHAPEYTPKIGALAKLLNKAVVISIGEDYIWSDKERLQFFKDNGLKNIKMSENVDVLFTCFEDYVEVYTRQKAGNARNYIGRISSESLKGYVKERWF